ncbi:hypothetical protein F4604DRAFT_1929022 [Suillus subluteus]|nr:hypothetical protein F4604DRAFT_1688187 [Suillus subluteus]KAG1863899.1 hypothetical protein F4604DRAFT_1929022 [Suillus subluteus]
MSSQPEFSIDLSDLTNIFEYAGSCLIAICIEMEKTKLKLSPKACNTVSRYLNWEAEVGQLDANCDIQLTYHEGIWIGLCSGLSLSPPLSQNLWYHIGVVAMKQLYMVAKFKDIYDTFMTLKPKGTGLVMQATLIIPKSTPVTQQLSNIVGEVEHEGCQIVKMLEDKVIEAQIMAASLLQMESVLGEDIIAAIAVTEKLAKFLKRETSP